MPKEGGKDFLMRIQLLQEARKAAGCIKDELHLSNAYPFLLPTAFYTGILVAWRNEIVTD